MQQQIMSSLLFKKDGNLSPGNFKPVNNKNQQQTEESLRAN